MVVCISHGGYYARHLQRGVSVWLGKDVVYSYRLYFCCSRSLSVPGRKGHFTWEPAARAKHALCGCYVADVVGGDAVLLFWVTGRHGDVDILGDALADIFEGGVVVELVGEAVNVN